MAYHNSSRIDRTDRSIDRHSIVLLLFLLSLCQLWMNFELGTFVCYCPALLSVCCGGGTHTHGQMHNLTTLHAQIHKHSEYKENVEKEIQFLFNIEPWLVSQSFIPIDKTLVEFNFQNLFCLYNSGMFTTNTHIVLLIDIVCFFNFLIFFPFLFEPVWFW